MQIEHEGQPLRGLRSRKAVALLAYLALREQAVSRTALVDFFWPDKSEQRGRANLSWAITHINKAIPGAFAAERHAVQINAANSALWLDTRAFTSHIQDGTIEARIRAVDLIRGELLEGLWLRDNAEYELWLRGEQERWRQLTADTLTNLSKHFEQAGKLGLAISYLERLLVRTPWRENAHRRLIRLFAQDGQRSKALAQYETCRQILLEELNVAPSPATESLIAAIRDNSFPGTNRPVVTMPRSAPAVHHLPRQFTAFFGRESELARIGRLVNEPETALVTIVGPGGVGKTRLALAAGSAHTEHFTDGVHLIPLAGLQHTRQFIPAVAEVLQYSFSDQPDRPAPREQLLSYMVQKNMLLILDNAEHLDDLHDELLTMLRLAPDVKLLVTSRHELPLQTAVLIHLRGLPFPPAETASPYDAYPSMQLLINRIQRRDENFANPAWHPALARICRLVEGYPLALELAAGLVPAKTPDQIVKHIIDNLDSLRVSYRDLPERHLSLRALFEHSWNLLSTKEQLILPQLTLFQSGFTAEAAQHITAVSAETLRGLAEKSLLQLAASDRYSLHNIPRHFLAGRLPASSPASVKHTSYYLALFQTAAADLRAARQVEIRQRLQPEEDNLRAAWKNACAKGDRAAITASLPGLYIYWARHGYAQFGVDFFTSAASIVEENGLQDLAAALRLHALGCLSAEEAGSQKYLAESLAAAEVMRSAGHEIKLAMAARLARLCVDFLTYGMTAADENIAFLLDECCTLLMAEGRELDLADVNLLQARLRQHRSDYLAGRQLFARAAEIYRRHNDWYALADTLYQLARMEYKSGAFAAAAECAVECQALYTRLGNRQGLQDSHTTLGFVAFQSGQYDEAQAAFETSLQLAQDLGNTVRAANNLSNLGVVAVEMGDLDAARNWYEQAFTQFNDLNDDAGIGIVLANQGILAEKARDLIQAQIFTEKSLSIRERIGDKYGLIYARNNLGFIYLGQQKYTLALEQFHVVLRQGIAVQNMNWQADALGGMAIAWAHMSRLEEGLELAGAVLAEEAASRYVRDKLDAFLSQLHEELPAAVIESRLRAGREKPFALLIKELEKQLSVA